MEPLLIANMVLPSALLGSLLLHFQMQLCTLVVKRASGESQSISGSPQSLCWCSSAFGSIVLLVTGLNWQFGISDKWFTFDDFLVLTVLDQVSFVPVLVLPATTLFATLMSIYNDRHSLGGLVELFSVTKVSNKKGKLELKAETWA